MTIYEQSLVGLICMFSAVFVLATFLKNNSIVDYFWGLGFIAVALNAVRLLYSVTYHSPWRYLPFFVIYLLVTVWGLRLSSHIFTRNWGKPEDKRYAAWRKKWGLWVIPRALLQIFMLQAVILWVISLPIQYAAAHPYFTSVESYGVPAVAWLVLGSLVWLFGFVFEARGDAELQRFLADSSNKGKVMMGGLWHYTRHPNYFGEATMWWGIFIIALAVHPPEWLLIISPLVITLSLRFVSGVPILEKKYAGNHQYELYRLRTPAMLPKFFKP
jgi:steroid 5-alpha reductase family enzyme